MDADKPSLSTTLTPHAAHCFFPPNSVSTLRGSYGKPGERTGRCLIRVLQLVCGIFIYKLPHQSPHAFRLRRLAQSVGRGSGRRQVVVLVGGILPVKFCIQRLLSNAWMHFDCAGSHKVWVAVLVGGRRRHFTCKIVLSCLPLACAIVLYCTVGFCPRFPVWTSAIAPDVVCRVSSVLSCLAFHSLALASEAGISCVLLSLSYTIVLYCRVLTVLSCLVFQRLALKSLKKSMHLRRGSLRLREM